LGNNLSLQVNISGQYLPFMLAASSFGHSEDIIIIILYYAIYGSTQIQKKAKIHLKYDLKSKKTSIQT